MILSIKEVSDAQLGRENANLFLIVKDTRPDIVLLGPNQDVSETNLEAWAKENGLSITVKRMPSMYDQTPLSSTSAIIKKIIQLEKSGKL